MALPQVSGLVTTHKDEKGRPTVFGSLPKHLGRVVSVGRLNLDSEGLLLLTNDGDIARRMEMPASGWTRTSRARLFGKVTQADLDGSQQASLSMGSNTAPSSPTLSAARACTRATVKLKEGKNREVKRVMERLGLKVARLRSSRSGKRAKTSSLTMGRPREASEASSDFLGKTQSDCWD